MIVTPTSTVLGSVRIDRYVSEHGEATIMGPFIDPKTKKWSWLLGIVESSGNQIALITGNETIARFTMCRAFPDLIVKNE